MVVAVKRIRPTPARIVNSRFMAYATIWAELVAERADGATGRTQQIVREGWQKILTQIKQATGRDYNRNVSIINSILKGFYSRLRIAIQTELDDALRYGYDSTFNVFKKLLPLQWWKMATVEIETEEADNTNEDRTKEYNPLNQYSPSVMYNSPALNRKQAKSLIMKGFRGQTWEQRLHKWTNKAINTDKIATIIAAGIQRGDDIDKISKRVEPLVGGLGSAAARLVRTEYHRVANLSNEQVYTDFGDLIIGYQLIEIRDEVTRPWHAARSGTIYWKPRIGREPNTNKKPQLPDEPNCRGTYSPVFGDPSDSDLVENGPSIDPKTYSTWFNDQPEKFQRKIVGPSRWDAVSDKLENPQWADFIDKDTGHYLPADELADTTKTEFNNKRRYINSVMSKREKEAAKYFPPEDGKAELPKAPVKKKKEKNNGL